MVVFKKFKRLEYILFVVLISLNLSCTVLSVAPGPNLNEIKYIQGNSLVSKIINVKVFDARKDQKFSKELVKVTEDIFVKQIKNLGGKILDSGDILTIRLKSYNYAQSSSGCTMIIVAEFETRSKKAQSFTVTNDTLYCSDLESKRVLSTTGFSKLLYNFSNWMR